MVLRILTMVALLLSVGCLSEPGQTGPESTAADASASTARSPDDSSQQRQSEPIDDAEQLAIKTNQQIDQLISSFEVQQKEWLSAIGKAKSSAERNQLRADSPVKEFCEQLLPLAEVQPGSAVALRVYREVLMKGDRESKLPAMQGMLEIADASPDSDQTIGTYLLLTQFGFGEAQKIAMNRLFDRSMADLTGADPATSSQAEDMLVQLVASNGDQQVKAKAARELLTRIDNDVRANLSANRLGTIATGVSGELQLAAVQRLVEHHASSNQLVDFLEHGTRRPSWETEQAIKHVCHNTTGHLQARAALAWAKYIRTRTYYSGLNDQQLASFGPQVIDYLRDENDPGELPQIELVLERYVRENEPIIKGAKERLYVLQQLSVGKTAPEIAGADLDGVEFKLSDYRGKVVFLDFWGDW